MKPEVQRWLKRAAGVVAVIFMLTAALIMRVHMRASASMDRSDEAFHHGSLRGALSEARQAARWYLPFSPNQERSYERLRAIAIGAESEGNYRLAQQAWEAIRGALLETAHPLPLRETDRQDLLQEANVQLARLLTSGELSGASEQRAKLLASYQRRLIPATPRVVSRSAGMAMILLSGLLLAFRPWGPSHRSLLLAPLALGVLVWVFSALGA